ncbi:hypothetical protein ACQ4PT_067995 [Festuca glaucescens]
MEPPPEASTPRRLAVADLLLIRRPTTGASSLFSSSPSPPGATSTSQPRKKPKHSPPNPAPTTAPFAPIPHPVLLAGTLSLPSASCSDDCRNHCLSLVDPSSAASVCCYLLDFDPAAIGREILILAWNYLPSIRQNEAGVLEVVRWRLAEFSGPVPGPSFLTSILLNCMDAEPDLATRGRVFGVVRSVSLVFSVPHAAQKSKADGGGDLVGFIAEMMCCGCRQCKTSQPESGQYHKFEVEKFVYFVDSASRWRPVLARLIGRPVSVTGLRKKMVSVGKKGSYTMLVSSAKTMVAWCPSYVGVPQSDELPGKCTGVYSGIVSGIYMHGMLVELDGIAWLLIDDKQLVPPHSLRIGAVISVKKLRLVRLNFAWTTVVLLGTCSKTSITINSFSLVDSKCHMRAENKGMSGKYVNSLDLSARFWTLLLTSCFRQKFKLGYEKEIWGSKNISSLPRRLQLVDDTGCIDIIVPDLLPNVCLDGIYEHQDTPGPSMYAEAVIMPYSLKFTGQDDCIEHAESFRMSSTRSLCDSKVPMEKLCYIPCSLSFRTTSLSGTLVSSYSCGSDGTILIDTSGEERGCQSRILLEFKEGCLLKYQLLRIGGYYLLECPSDSSSFAVKGCGCFQCGKISLDSQDKLWSLAITFNGNGNIKQGTVDQSTGEVDEPFSRNTSHNEIRLVQSWNDFHQYLDFQLKFYCEAVSGKMEEYNALCSVLNGLCSYSIEVITVSSCTDIMMRKKPFGSSNLQSEKLVQGDLISLHGKVENIHSHDCKDRRLAPGNEKHNICIHLADDNQTVLLRGYLSKHCYPVGIGRGASVTFHRVLLTRQELLLTTVTYIEVTSISHTELNRECATSPLMPGGLKDSSPSTVLPCPILHEKHFKDSRPMQFQCRVVTIHLLVLDSCLNDLQTSEAANNSKILAVQVPLAGFIVDNGTSLCCCWADDARAELLLRLQEIAVLDASVSLKFSKDRKKANLQQTFGSCLQKMLKKHKNVIVKNYGIPPDTSCRDLELSSGIGNVLSSLEQKLLKFMVLNACCKGTVNVTASVLDPNTIKASNVGLTDVYPVHNMQNFWVNASFQVDSLEEARRLLTTLENS